MPTDGNIMLRFIEFFRHRILARPVVWVYGLRKSESFNILMGGL